MDNKFSFVSEILQKNNIRPLYPFEYNKVIKQPNFVINWKYYYSTPAYHNNKKVFIKILLNNEKLEDFKHQAYFFEYLKNVKLQHIKFQSIISYDLERHPWMMFEYVEGYTLGFLDGPKSKFASIEILNKIRMGIEEFQNSPKNNAVEYEKVKDFPWFYRLLSEMKIRIKDAKAQNIITQNDIDDVINTVKKYEDKISITYYLHLGDVNPGNIVIQNGTVYLLDQAPFFLANKWADVSEFASYCILTSKWKQLVKKITVPKEEQPLYNINLLVYLTDRIIKLCELMKLFGNFEKYSKKIKILKQEIKRVKGFL